MSDREKQGSSVSAEALLAVLALIVGVVLYERGLTWVLIVAGVAFVLALAGRWAVFPSHTLSRNRERGMRIRLRLRLYPGHGMATVGGLWLRWGRFAAYRHSGRIRALLPRWYRLTTPDCHSVYLGTAQYRHGLRSRLDTHVAVFSPPRKGKSGWLARVINHYPGPVVSTTTKPDVFRLTSGLRSRLGPIRVFCPQQIGGLRSSFTWDPIGTECADPSVAIRRADAFADGISTKGMEGGDFWKKKARDFLRPMFCAAGIAGLTLQDVYDWIQTGNTDYAEAVLSGSGHAKWAAQLSELRSPAERTTATIQMTMSSALAFLADPRLASSVLPGPGLAFDIAAFIRECGTLYMVAAAQGEDAPLAPLFACLANEVHFTASMMAADYPDGHLDPGMGMFLDEVTQICPVPVPTWAADSGGKGIQLFVIAHGVAQLAERWGEHGARIVLDTAGVLAILPGVTDTATLDMAEKLCGTFPAHERGAEHVIRHPVMSASMVRELPDEHALVLRDNLRPVLARMPMAWRDRLYRRAKRRGETVALTVPAALADPMPAGQALDTTLAEPLPSWLPASAASGAATAEREREHGSAAAEPEHQYPWAGGR